MINPGPPAEPTPTLVQAIENNLLLKQALEQLRQIKDQQAVNHLVAIQLRDHDTIARVESLWSTMGQVQFLLKVIAGLLGTILASGSLITATHLIYHIP